RDPRRRLAHLRGPDGQVAEVPLRTGTVAGFPGRIETASPAPADPDADEPADADADAGHETETETETDAETDAEVELGLVARFPLEDLCWRFDPEGRPVEIDAGPGRRVVLGWEGERLVRLAHERGRSFGLEWTGERITAAVADDGRRVDYAYDDGGRLVAVDGPLGLRRYAWDAAGRLEAATDADGVTPVRNAYDGTGRVTAQVTASGRRVQFGYRPDLVTDVGDDRGGPVNRFVHDEKAQLVQVVDGLGHATTTVYDDDGHLAKVIDRRGGTTSYRWDRAGRCRHIERPDGTTVALDWDDRHRCVATTGPGGAACRFGYTGDDRTPNTIEDPEGAVTRLDVVDGLVRRVVDADGVVLRFDHDDQGRVVAVTDGDGHVLAYEWDAAGQLVATTSPLGHRLEVERDAAGLVVGRRTPDGARWRVERSPAGRVLAVVDPAGHRQELRRGPDGNVVEDVDPTGAVTRFGWDEHGVLVAVEQADGHRWTFAHDALLRPMAVTDPVGSTWLREYDPEGALVATVTPTGVRRAVTVAETGAITRVHDGLTSVRFEYDRAGRAVGQVRPDGTRARCEYDRCGRIVAITEATGGVSRFGYSPAGRLTSVVGATGGEVAYRYDPLGRLCEVVDAEGGRRRLRYDADGRVVQLTGPTGEVTRYTYDAVGRVVAVTAPDGGVTRYAFDPVGRPVEVTGPDGSVTRTHYDAAGRVTGIVDPNGGHTRLERDAVGRVVAQVDPNGARWSQRLDPRGNPVETTDPLGRTTHFGYDPAGRLVHRVDPDGARHWWRWDDSDRLAATGTDDVETRLTYDALGRVTGVEQTDGEVVTRAWDADGRLVSETVGLARATWARDLAGNVVAAALETPGLAPAVTGYELDLCGRPVEISDPVLGPVAIERDAAGRPVSVEVTVADGIRLVERRQWQAGLLAGWVREADGQRVASAELTRDQAGRVAERRDRTGVGDGDGATTRYAYDAAGQLIGVGGDAGDWRFTWDPAGRLVAEDTPHGAHRLTYDPAGQLVTIDGPEGETHVEWDACGRRLVERGPDGRRRHFRWDPRGWLAGLDTTGADGRTWRRELAHDALGRLAAVDGSAVRWDPTGPLARLWVVGEHRLAAGLAAGGGPAAVVAPSGAVALAPSPGRGDGGFLLDPWGDRAPRRPAPAPGLDGTAAGDQGGAGSFALDVGPGPDHLRDLDPGGDPGLVLGHRGELTIDGLVWLRARAYDPATRSFLSPDPLPGLPGHPWTSHPYQYAANDPVGWADPSGLRPLTDAELAAIRDGWHDNAWDRYGGYIVAGLAIVGAVAVFLVPGIGPLASSMLIGGLLTGGMSAGVQQAVNGEVDWARVGIEAVIGAGAGGLGFMAGSLPSVAALTPLARGALLGAFESTYGGMTVRAAYGQDPFDPAAVSLDILTGGVSGGAGGYLGARNAGLAQVDGAVRWPTGQAALADPNVRVVVDDATGVAWSRSNPDLPSERREQGGWIIGNDQTGAVRSVGSPPGHRTRLDPGPLPPLQPGERLLAHYHTHPNPSDQALGTYPKGSPITLDSRPGPMDISAANRSGIPEVVRSHDTIWTYDPAIGVTTSRPIPR
ncbi:MAG TPA: RHS repeat-associated core domain-containing protein, partial [Acidimicrobiales bacterium]|nr:RHS repeat-associated core domain-containing protein [Acidimicrobiales bacterium]